MNRRKTQPRVRSRSRVSGSRAAPCGRSRIAARAGLSVSELSAERTVETAIVTANWRKNWPVIPLMNAHGTNTAHEHQGHGDDRPGDLVHRPAGRLRGVQPLLQPALDVLDDDDGVVDHDADGQDQAEQRDVVQAEAQRGHDGEGADDGDRHGDQGDQGGPPVLQEDQHHERRPGPTASSRVRTTSSTDSRMNGVVS